MPRSRRWFDLFEGYDTRCDLPAAELATLEIAGVLGPPANAIDLGCGHATDAIFLAQLGWNVRAVDRDDDDQQSLTAARRRVRELPSRVAARIRFQRADALSPRFRVPDGARFELVLSRLVLNNLVLDDEDETPDTSARVRLIASAARVAADDALFILRTTAFDTLEPELESAIRTSFVPLRTHRPRRLSIDYPALATPSVTGAGHVVSVGVAHLKMYLLRRRPRAPRRSGR